MVDVFTPKKRSDIMSRIKGKNTKPEILVRKLVHSLGYRFRLHCATLPGKPDIVFSKRKKIIFVHGCFWHGHAGCRRATLPSTNKAFWQKKIEGNQVRDKTAEQRLRHKGWDVLIVWQCQTTNKIKIEHRLKRFLGH